MNFAFLKRFLPSRRWRRQPSDPRARVGLGGEGETARFLTERGCRILARNYECDLGEVDLIASEGDTIVFVEVKSRSDSPSLDHPQFGVRPSQRDRIGRAARHFLRTTKAEHRPARFDIVTVQWQDGAAPRIEHFKDAFHPRGIR